MKNKWILIILIISTVTACDLFEKESFPEPPENYTEMTGAINLEFKINRMDGISVEMSLSGADESNNLYFLYELSSDWVKGHFGLVLKDVSSSSILEENTGIFPDISRFQKDNDGNEVKTYSFDNLLIEDDQGMNYLKLSYTGPAMPLIESLQVEKNLVLPVRVSDWFGIEQDIEFQAGKYGLDANINGFWIPVLLK